MPCMAPKALDMDSLAFRISICATRPIFSSFSRTFSAEWERREGRPVWLGQPGWLRRRGVRVGGGGRGVEGQVGTRRRARLAALVTPQARCLQGGAHPHAQLSSQQHSEHRGQHAPAARSLTCRASCSHSACLRSRDRLRRGVVQGRGAHQRVSSCKQRRGQGGMLALQRLCLLATPRHMWTRPCPSRRPRRLSRVGAAAGGRAGALTAPTRGCSACAAGA